MLYQFNWEVIKNSGLADRYTNWLSYGGLSLDAIFEKISFHSEEQSSIIWVKKTGKYAEVDPSGHHSFMKDFLKPFKPRPLGDWK